MTSVGLLPIRFEIGALPRAPKKAPAWRTDTTLEDTSFVFLVFGEPSAFNIPKCVWKNGCVTTPPAIPLRNLTTGQLARSMTCHAEKIYVSYPKRIMPQYAINASPVKRDEVTRQMSSLRPYLTVYSDILEG